MRRTYARAFVGVLVLGLVMAAGPAGAQSRKDVPALTVSWANGPTAPFSATRFDGALVNGKVYFLGFRNVVGGVDTTDGSVWSFDVATRTYADTGVDMKAPVSNYQIAVLQDATGTGLYIFGGRDATGVILNTTQVYYPATNQTRVVNSDPWPGTTPSGCISLPAMGVATVSNRAFVLGGLAFQANGCVLNEASSQTWQYDPMAAAGTRWSAGPDLNMARGYITPAVAQGRIYAIGGDIANPDGTLTAQRIVESWKPGSAAWSNRPADLPGVGCDESQTFLVGGGAIPFTIVLAGCGQWPNAVPDTLAYDLASNSWSAAGTLITNRRNHAGEMLTVGGRQRMYIFGGFGEATAFVDSLDTSELGTAGALSAPHGRGSLASPVARTASTT